MRNAEKISGAIWKSEEINGSKKKVVSFTGHLSEEALKNIPEDIRSIFLIFVSFEVMFDEVAYTYFPLDYQYFQSLTLFPKYYFCGHGPVGEGSPFGIYFLLPKQFRIFSKRRTYLKQGPPQVQKAYKTYKECSREFITYMNDFLSKHTFTEMTMRRVKTVILNDKDIYRNVYGRVFQSILKNTF